MNKNDFVELYIEHGNQFTYPLTADELKQMLEDDEVQKLLKQKLASRHTANMIEVYNSMFKSATKESNVSAAKWMVDFDKTRFLDETESEMEKLIKKLNTKKG